VLKPLFSLDMFSNEAINIAKFSARLGFELWRQAIVGGEA
jgi:hypothetical protein